MAKGTPPFVPTEDQRKLVKQASIFMTNAQVADFIGISETTLKKYFPEELKLGAKQANINVGSALYKSAMGGNVTAQIFWCKTRLQWKEVDRTELTGAEGVPLTPILNITINKKAK
jgi:hypothetical protein